MSDIAPIGRSSAAAYNPALNGSPRETSPAASPKRQGDAVSFSPAARYLAKLAETPDVREDLVASVKASIEQGSYESDEKLDVAVSRLFEDLA